MRHLVENVIDNSITDHMKEVSSIPRSLGMYDLHNMTDNTDGDGDSNRYEQPEIVIKVIEYLDENTVKVYHNL